MASVTVVVLIIATILLGVLMVAALVAIVLASARGRGSWRPVPTDTDAEPTIARPRDQKD